MVSNPTVSSFESRENEPLETPLEELLENAFEKLLAFKSNVSVCTGALAVELRLEDPLVDPALVAIFRLCEPLFWDAVVGAPPKDPPPAKAPPPKVPPPPGEPPPNDPSPPKELSEAPAPKDPPPNELLVGAEVATGWLSRIIEFDAGALDGANVWGFALGACVGRLGAGWFNA